jgi:hypothetical protein
MSLPRAEKITLAKSAAPPEVSDKATVYVLDSTGYVKAQDGSNGFSCFVDRQTPLNQETYVLRRRRQRDYASHPLVCGRTAGEGKD